MKTCKTLTNFILTIVIILIVSFNVSAQNEPVVKKSKNTIQLDCATLIYVGMWSVNYERTILQSTHYNIIINAGFGGWYLTTISKWYSGYSFPLSFNNIIGSGNNHFEVDLGLRYTNLSDRVDNDRYSYFPVLNIGYRYQRPDGKGLLFRSFIGLTGIGIGLGKAF